MSMHLYDHNQQAYNAAVTMLNERGKAAVIHPTGTGKSFIGFKLCEDNPDKTVCWFSPSRYIYQTQLENLAETSDGWQPENVVFYTYAKLIYLTESEIEDIKPDYIILDEFHRLGAEVFVNAAPRTARLPLLEPHYKITIIKYACIGNTPSAAPL